MSKNSAKQRETQLTEWLKSRKPVTAKTVTKSNRYNNRNNK